MNLGISPISLFDVAAAGVTLSKLIFPGTNTCTLPKRTGTLGSTSPVAAIMSGVDAVGAVFAPPQNWGSVLLDFACVGAADVQIAVEFGRFSPDAAGTGGGMAVVMGSATLKAITTAGTIANFNPFTGVAVASTTFRLFDLVTLTELAALNQLWLNVGGAEDQTPAQLGMDVTESAFYYVLLTSLGSATRAICYMTPQA